jgi:hypothetical protein
MMIQVGCNACMWSEWIVATELSDAAVIARAEEAWAVHVQSPVPFEEL